MQPIVYYENLPAIKVLVAVVIVNVLGVAVPAAQPDLTPFKPPGWSDKIVVARTMNTTTDSTNLLTTDTLYLAFSIINQGNQNVTNTFDAYLYVDGVFSYSFPIAGLNSGFYTYYENYSLGSFSPGTHTLQIVADATMVVTNDNHADDSYTKTITVSPVLFATPTPYTPVNASTAQQTVPWFSWSPVTNATSYRILIATNAADLPTNSLATNGGASVVIDAVSLTTNFSPTIQLSANRTYYWKAHAIGSSEEDGAWTAVQSFTTAALAAGITIVPTFDSTITSDPQAATIEATINAAISVYRSDFSDPITVTITFSEMDSGLGQNDSYFDTGVSYSSYRAALVSHATTADDTTALVHLPSTSTNPVTGSAAMALGYPLARALGFSANPPPGQPDSIIYLNTSIMNFSSFTTDPNKFSLFATVSHEIDEVLGFGSILNGLTNGEAAPTGGVEPEDLFRYTSNGTRSLTTALNASSFFSLDGANDLAQFNQYQGGDFGDWYSYYGGVVPQVQDAYLINGANPVLTVELRGLDAIGFTPAILSSLVPQLTGVKVVGTNCQFNLLGAVGSNYIVQYTSNFVAWTPLSTNTIPTSASVIITNAISTNMHRFYRARLQ